MATSAAIVIRLELGGETTSAATGRARHAARCEGEGDERKDGDGGTGGPASGVRNEEVHEPA